MFLIKGETELVFCDPLPKKIIGLPLHEVYYHVDVLDAENVFDDELHLHLPQNGFLEIELHLVSQEHLGVKRQLNHRVGVLVGSDGDGRRVDDSAMPFVVPPNQEEAKGVPLLPLLFFLGEQIGLLDDIFGRQAIGHELILLEFS